MQVQTPQNVKTLDRSRWLIPVGIESRIEIQGQARIGIGSIQYTPGKARFLLLFYVQRDGKMK